MTASNLVHHLSKFPKLCTFHAISSKTCQTNQMATWISSISHLRTVHIAQAHRFKPYHRVTSQPSISHTFWPLSDSKPQPCPKWLPLRSQHPAHIPYDILETFEPSFPTKHDRSKNCPLCLPNLQKSCTFQAKPWNPGQTLQTCEQTLLIYHMWPIQNSQTIEIQLTHVLASQTCQFAYILTFWPQNTKSVKPAFHASTNISSNLHMTYKTCPSTFHTKPIALTQNCT